MQSDNRRNVLVGVALLIIVILIILFVVRNRQTGSLITVNSPLPTSVGQFQQDLQNNFGITVPDGATTANLRDVTGKNQMGLATLDKSSGQNNYTIIGNLEDPTPGYFYQAWLVNGTDYVSLGKLDIAKAGWLVNFTSIKDISDHKTVWITLEKYFDNTPEAHILEGSY